MITQIFVNFVRDIILNWVSGWPPLPPEINSLLPSFTAAVTVMNDSISKLGVFVPFTTLNNLITVFLAVLAFWFVLLIVRFVAWAAAR